MTEVDLVAGKTDYLERTTLWPPAAVQEAHEHFESLTADDLHADLMQLTALVGDAMERGSHHYVRFIGD